MNIIFIGIASMLSKTVLLERLEYPQNFQGNVGKLSNLEDETPKDKEVVGIRL